MRETWFGNIESIEEALILVEAARLNILPRVQGRVNASVHAILRSGVIFVWDEIEAGILRWTDGKKWSSSKAVGDFTVYVEISPENVHKAVWDRLHKKVISFVTKDNRKFHLVAYYTPKDVADKNIKDLRTWEVEYNRGNLLKKVSPPQNYYSKKNSDVVNIPADFWNKTVVEENVPLSPESLPANSDYRKRSNSSHSDTSFLLGSPVSSPKYVLPSISTLFEIADKGSYRSSNVYSLQRSRSRSSSPYSFPSFV
ncbi:Gti1/Pac2 family-domain-containing protein [Paraphysoderma sedebokerense]|nr:Gti1/Pac2 family-domain-containing protein [Paraphysoderma sedebokerense]